jgi:hypothetical protein
MLGYNAAMRRLKPKRKGIPQPDKQATINLAAAKGYGALGITLSELLLPRDGLPRAQFFYKRLTP